MHIETLSILFRSRTTHTHTLSCVGLYFLYFVFPFLRISTYITHESLSPAPHLIQFVAFFSGVCTAYARLLYF